MQSFGPRLPEVQSDPVFVSTRNLKDLVSFEAENLTIHVQAGMPLEAIQQLSKSANAFLPAADRSHGCRTIGGLIAEGVEGAEAYAFGSLQDFILGMEFVSPDGHLVKTGGCTVKNAAGYDLGRLHWRARGGFGLITGVTLRLAPQVQRRRTVLVNLSCLPDLIDSVETVRKAGLSILSLTGASHGKERRLGWRLCAVVGGALETVRRHTMRIQGLMPCGKAEILSEADAEEFHRPYAAVRVPEGTLALRGRGDRRSLYAALRDLNGFPDSEAIQAEIDFGLSELRLGFHAGQQDVLKALIRTRRSLRRFVFGNEVAVPGTICLKLKRGVDPHHLFSPHAYPNDRPTGTDTPAD